MKARVQRELYSREGELNRSQARERVTKKELSQLKAELDAERAMNGQAKVGLKIYNNYSIISNRKTFLLRIVRPQNFNPFQLDMEKQALKRACRHHKTKAESLKLQNEELTLDLNRTQTELSAWKERSRRNDVEADDNLANLKESERGNIY